MALIHRSIIRTISGLLPDHVVVLVEGPPRCGKSTMARQLAASASSGAVFADARLRDGRAILAAPGNQSAARPIILDNAERADAAALLSWARGIGWPGGGEGGKLRIPRFVLVGGPFDEPEPPAEPLGDRAGGRTARVQMGPLSLFEAGRASLRRLWLRGGYPEAFEATNDETASAWLESYTADLAYGSLAAWGLPREPALVTGLLEAIAGQNGQAFNENAAARALGVSRPTIVRYLGILERAGILFRLPGLSPDRFEKADMQPGTDRKKHVASRAIKSPALYIRDSGLLHALLGVRAGNELALKPSLAAASWAGFVVAQAREALPPGAELYRYASADGAALDLVVVRNGLPVLAAAAGRHRPTSVERSISYAASATLGRGDPETDPGSAPRRYIVVPEGGERLLPGSFVVVGLGVFLEKVAITL